MADVSLFRGSAGKIFVDCLSPKFFIVCLPLVLYYLAVINLSFIMTISNPILYFSIAGFIGFAGSFAIFTVNGRNGYTDIFWLDHTTSAISIFNVFVIFSALLALIALSLHSLTVYLNLDTDEIISILLTRFEGFSPKDKVIAVAGLIFLCVGVGTIITVFALVATYCRSVLDLFSLEPWKKVVLRSFGDVMFINALTIAQVFFTIFVYITPFILFLIFVDQIISLSSMHITLAMTLPILLSAIGLGKLTGTLVYDSESSTFEQGTSNTLRSKTKPKFRSLAASAQHRSQSARPSDSGSLSIASDGDSPRTVGGSSAIDKALELHASRPDDLHILIRLTELLLQAKKIDEYVAQLNRAIALGIKQNNLVTAGRLYRSAEKYKNQIKLSSHEFTTLATFFEKKNHFIDAWRCYSHAYAVLSSPTKEAQSKILELAKAASASNCTNEAVQLYQHFLKRYPNSNLCDYARNALDMLTID